MYVHPELAPVLAGLPERVDAARDIEAARANFKALMAPRMGPDERVTVEHRSADGVDVQIVRPVGATGTRPAVLYVHGGSFSFGELDGPSPMARDVCATTGAVVVNVHYRLAPEHVFPAGFDDCYTALCWLAEHAAELDVDPERIAVAGASAGGCLCAALCLAARDRGGPRIAFQTLLIPCLDDRCDTPSMRAVTDPRFTNGGLVSRMWDVYLGADREQGRGHEHGSGHVSPYAAPARADDLSGLPPAYVLTCGADPLRDEGLDYARRLMEADVPVTVKDVPGAWHLFEAFAPDSSLARETTAHWLAALRDALK
ncbi:alpha/beta hydrolase [Actinomadura rupiterrae]|uniref:alpha/beta hydrolase n=1 Tax=Actinomadura rupiterrae TaxID=559627 RepID=UPI0020A610B0|nr:alpha/beta hydrolase [Actinomadura rupiterrae]MCP2336615.1 acetyl esterase/lipase [Actinomadura rupiterrae]